MVAVWMCGDKLYSRRTPHGFSSYSGRSMALCRYNRAAVLRIFSTPTSTQRIFFGIFFVTPSRHIVLHSRRRVQYSSPSGKPPIWLQSLMYATHSALVPSCIFISRQAINKNAKHTRSYLEFLYRNPVMRAVRSMVNANTTESTQTATTEALACETSSVIRGSHI